MRSFRLFIIASSVAILSGSLVGCSSAGSGADPSEGPPPGSESAAGGMPGMDHSGGDMRMDPSGMDAATWEFVVKSGKVEGADAIQVQAGRMVHLTVTSDSAGTVHVHGYEITQGIEAGQTKTLMLQADAPGRFAVTLDAKSEMPITELEVTP